MLENINLYTVLNDPLLVALLTITIVAIHHYVKQMPYREFIFIHRVKCYLFSALDKFARSRKLVIIYEVEVGKDSEQYIETVDASPREVASKIRQNGFSAHIISSIKYRILSGFMQFSHSHWSYQHGDGRQTEIWFFENADGTTDVYGHVETSIYTPVKHLLQTETVFGDARNAFRNAWHRD